MPIDADPLRIEQDLRGQLDGEVRCDRLLAQLYASDGSIYEIQPFGVVRPRSAADISATVAYANQRGIPLHPRGSGSGLAGETLGEGLVVDFSRFLKRIQDGPDDTVVVQPGVVLDALNEHLAKRHQVLGPNPANSDVTTLGGMAAIDSSGSRWHAFGSMHERVLEVEAVLNDGRIVRFNRGTKPNASATFADDPLGYLAHGVHRILEDHQQSIRAYHEKSRSLVDRSGYHLHQLRREGLIDLARLLIGSEGTLALTTQLTLAPLPLPQHVGCVMLLFDSLDQSAEAAAELSERRPAACDLMDRRHLSLARELDPRYELMIPPSVEAVLLVEHHAATQQALVDALNSTADLIHHQRGLASGSQIAFDQQDYQLMAELAKGFTPTLYQLKGSTRPISFVEDIAVPPKALPEFLRQTQQTLNRKQVTASLFGHVGHGQLHIRPFLDLANPGDVEKIPQIAQELYEHALGMGGTISGEHADGLSRTPYYHLQHGPLVEAFAEIKKLFDPAGILNPGKKAATSPAQLTANLRQVAYPLLQRLATTDDSSPSGPPPAADPQAAAEGQTTATLAPIELQLDWQPNEMTRTARICNGCATCRTQAVDTRMCPIFHISTREEASPRAKANLARGLLTGSLPPETILEDACKEIADLCVHCHMCRLECPAQVDIPKLMLEAKASHVATNGLRSSDWAFARIDRLSKIASQFPMISNWALSNRGMRWLLEKTFGIAQSRKLPYFKRRTFLQQAAARKLHRPQRSTGEKVLLFVDTYANHCDTQLAEALTAVLEHNGISVYVPREQLEAAMPLIAQGALDPARKRAEHNVELLAEAVRQGYTIVSPEPSAVLALTHEYPLILAGDSDAQMVAKNTFEACHYLWRWHQRGKLQLDFQAQTLTLGYHAPCHMKALQVGEPSVNLLNLIPGVRIRTIEKGCSGMAGLYGFKKQNYRRSLRVGLPLLTEMRTGDFQAGATECSACRIQMEQGSDKPTLHPVKVLALAYGIMPELRELLTTPSEPLRVR